MISVEKAKEVGEYVNKYGFDTALGYYKIGEETLQRYLRLYRKVVADVPTESHQVKTVQDALLFGNTDAFQGLGIQSVTVNSWGSETNPNKQVKVKLLPDPAKIDTKVLIDDFRKEVEQYVPNRYTPSRKITHDQCMVEINIPDFHMGLLAWAKETRNYDYDINIARTTYLDAVSHLVNATKMYNPSKYLLMAGSDFFNSDTIENTTSHGTRQTEDGRFQKSFNLGWKTIRDAVEIMKEVADVEVVVISGNHDHSKAFYLGEVISAWFNGDKHVTVDNDPPYYKYKQWGKCLIGLTHGENSKPDALPQIMACDVPQMWADTLYRVWHTGHRHTRLVFESPGCVVEYIRSLASASDWTALKGYRSMRECRAFVWDKQYGDIASINYKPEFIK